MAKKGAGRPDDLTPAISQSLADSFRKGASVKVACALAGVGLTTFHRWMELGEDDKSPVKYRDFRNLMNESRAKPELEAYEAIRTAFLNSDKPDWKAAKAYLDLKDPNRWKKDKPQQLDININPTAFGDELKKLREEGN